MLGRRHESGKATIVAKRQTSAGVDGYAAFEWVAEVRPDSGAPMFRATVGIPFKHQHFIPPAVGDVVGVTFDPKSQHVKFDASDPSLDGDVEREREAEDFDAVLRAAPGSVRGGASARGEQSSAAGELADALAEMSDATAGLAAASGEVANTLAGAPAESGEHTDPVERLSKLADLHDRGVLTDAEFAAAKAKLL